MRILYVSTVPLYPVSDGVRIPATHAFRALSEFAEVDGLFLIRKLQFSERENSAENAFVQGAKILSVEPRRFSRAVWGELFLGEPVYGALRGGRLETINRQDYDLIWCATSPASAYVASGTGRKIFGNVPAVAGVSDLHSLVVCNQGLHASKSVSLAYRRWKEFAGSVRGRILFLAEMKMLGRFSLVMVQSEKESAWVARHGDIGLTAKVRILPNGVNDSLFALPIVRERPRLVFVGRLDGLYAARLSWFLTEVYVRLKKQYPTVELVVIGKAPTGALQQLFAVNKVKHISFVDDLQDVYRDKVALVAPIFKGFGLINKVVEAMAAGCAVVGDRTAFNGIEGFVSGKHGLVADDAEAFIRQLSALLSSLDWQAPVRLAGRQMVHEKFSWRTRYARIQSEVCNVVASVSSATD